MWSVSVPLQVPENAFITLPIFRVIFRDCVLLLLRLIAALIATIVDTGFEYGIKTFSVTTKSWKSAVLGSSKPVFEPVEGVSNPQKFGSVQKAIDLGFFEQMKVVSAKKRNAYTLDDDMADAICMSLYPFSGQPYHLELED